MSTTKFAATVGVLLTCATGFAATAINVIPRPVTVEQGAGTFALSPKTPFVVDDPKVKAYVSGVMEMPVVDQPQNGAVVLTTTGADPSLGDEGYDLTVTTDGATVKAPHSAGLFYGVQTLRQLTTPDGHVPVVHILDKPRFPYRGMMLDSGRHMQSKQYIEQFIDKLAELKMNRFHWHLTEDQGWRIEIKKYPELTRVGAWREKDGQRYGGFYSQQDVKEVVAYAEARFVTIIPEIEMPGHSTAAVASYPWLGCTGQQVPVRWEWGISPHVLCPAKDTTYEFCENVLTEVMGLFPNSPVIHIGGDECPKQEWKADPGCQAMIKKLGLKDENALQGYFTSRIAHFLADHGRRLQGWNEIMEGSDLPKGVIVQQWNAPHSATLAAEAGLDVVCSPTSHCYFDYAYGQIPTHKVLEFEPVPTDLQPDLASHILGAQGNLWTEWMNTEKDVDRMAWPRGVALAEAVWSPKGDKDWDDFTRRAQVWIDRQPEDQQALLKEHLLNDSDHGRKVGVWTPATVSTQEKELTWNVSKLITGPGAYEIWFDYRTGAHGLDIDEVTLTPGGTTDKHPAFTGAMNKDNGFKVTIEEHNPDAKYVLHAKVRSDGGTDSTGTVFLKKRQ